MSCYFNVSCLFLLYPVSFYLGLCILSLLSTFGSKHFCLWTIKRRMMIVKFFMRRYSLFMNGKYNQEYWKVCTHFMLNSEIFLY